MSQENVEIVRRAVEAVLRTPKPDFDTISALYHPDHEFVSLVERFEGGVAEGARGYRDWLAGIDETWERWDSRARSQVRRIDRDRVLVDACTFTGTSQSRRCAGRWVDDDARYRPEGKITRSEVFPSR